MSSTANKGIVKAEDYTPLADPEIKDKLNYNQRQKAGKLVRQILHKSNYGLAMFAQSRLKVNELQAELVELGLPPVDLVNPDLTDPDKLREYAEAANYKQD